jgi:DNA mismatch repair protein MutS
MSRQDETPLMQQWRDAKARHPDALIFFRVGDFYEMFHEDAEEGARLLGLTLTSRNNGAAARVPLAGVPARSRDDYIERLVRQGRRVAICEQVEDPADAKGIVRREVVETVTPGVVLADTLLTAGRNNFLVAVVEWPAGVPAPDGQPAFALAAVDASTGEVLARAVAADALDAELARLEPAELLLPERWGRRALPGAGRASLTERPDWYFDAGIAADEVRRRYRVQGLDGLGFQPADEPLVAAVGALLAYVAEIQPAVLESLRPPAIDRGGAAMPLDEMTRRNLELVEPLRPDLAGKDETLLGVLDATLTPMGGRLLRRWILSPLVAAERIWRRQDAVAELAAARELRQRLRAALRQIRDLDRLATKVAAGRVTPRELRALADSLLQLPQLAATLAAADSAALRDIAGLDTLPDLHQRIDLTLAAEPPAVMAEGGVIRAGYSPELDELRALRDGARDFIASLQTRERERTGIATLKVGYNRVFGYYLEVTRTKAERVPEGYERKQTLANAERYVTTELKEWEAKVLGAEERVAELETALFAALRRDIAAQVPRLAAAAGAVARADVLAALSEVAERRGYVRPEVHTGFDLEIRAGRHPVVETMMPRDEFIPNDVVLAETPGSVMILTGPNMAGKSTLLRQVGLIQIMAQMGGFVPAAAARLPVCDRVFTRVGASDNLVRGQSTFLVEMSETSAILNAATGRSLVLLDEIGRGTATYDGVSIAWAVTEHLVEEIGAKTIFATHYHELTQLADLLGGVVNTNVAVREVGEEIVFLRRLEAGGADRSYGIQVGRLAGLPRRVVERAREILHELEGAHSAGGEGLGRAGPNRPKRAASPEQLSLFQVPEPPVVRRLRELQIDGLTPLQALNLLAELQLEAGSATKGAP